MRRIHRDIFINDFNRINQCINNGYISLKALNNACGCDLSNSMFKVISKSKDYVKLKPMFNGYYNFIIECFIVDDKYIIKSTNLETNKSYEHKQQTSSVLSFCRKVFK